jgi:23S rRNA pseudouridine1911/1915/1917 synthase
VSPPDATTIVHATVAPEAAGGRLDRWLAATMPDLSRERLKALILTGGVSLSGATIREPSHTVKAGDAYSVRVPAPVPAEPVGQPIPLTIEFEDAHLIVIDKPAGLVVHPAAGHADGTLVNALIAHCGDSLSGIGGVRRPGIVHRLDKDTSGLLVIAKTDAAHQGLAAQFEAHGRDGRLERAYLALVWGAPDHPQGTIDLPLARSTQNRTKIAVSRSGGREAVTHWRLLEAFDDAKGKPIASLLRVTLETGRTHQIRVHLAHRGHPVMGDATYGAGFAASARRLDAHAAAALQSLGRQALHAAVLGFEHPIDGRALRFESALPDDIATLINALRPAPTIVPIRSTRKRRR